MFSNCFGHSARPRFRCRMQVIFRVQKSDVRSTGVLVRSMQCSGIARICPTGSFVWAAPPANACFPSVFRYSCMFFNSLSRTYAQLAFSYAPCRVQESAGVKRVCAAWRRACAGSELFGQQRPYSGFLKAGAPPAMKQKHHSRIGVGAPPDVLATKQQMWWDVGLLVGY